MSGLKGNVIVGGKRVEGEREKDDFYPTPPNATRALLDREKFEGTIWESACGKGHMAEVMKEYGYEVISTDLVDRGYGETGINFLETEVDKKVGNVVTNPPFKIAQEFIEKGLEVSEGKVAMLLKLAFLEGVKRNEMFKNTPLKKVYVFSKRLNFDFEKREKSSPLMAFAWFVWEHGYEGKPEIEWIL